MKMNTIFKGKSLLLYVVIFSGFLFIQSCQSIRIPQFFQSETNSAYQSITAEANGELIYFRGSSIRGTKIEYTGGGLGNMGMHSQYYTCASCHGPGGQGGKHFMHMQLMDAADIRWSTLSSDEEEHEENDKDESNEHMAAHEEYDIDDFRQAVIGGKHPDGEPLDEEMPRWKMSDDDLYDLMAYLKTLP